VSTCARSRGLRPWLRAAAPSGAEDGDRVDMCPTQRLTPLAAAPTGAEDGDRVMMCVTPGAYAPGYALPPLAGLKTGISSCRHVPDPGAYAPGYALPPLTGLRMRWDRIGDVREPGADAPGYALRPYRGGRWGWFPTSLGGAAGRSQGREPLVTGAPGACQCQMSLFTSPGGAAGRSQGREPLETGAPGDWSPWCMPMSNVVIHKPRRGGRT
jgi:hypothetical protein